MSEMARGSLQIPISLAEKLLAEASPSEVALQVNPDSRLYSVQEDGALGTEQLRMLLARLTEIRTARPFKNLLITSAVRGEGKTHVAANLALTLAAEGNGKILLIDTDVRNASVRLALGIPNSHGFNDWLLSGGSPWRAIQKIKRKNLYVMAGGTATLPSLGPARISCLEALLDEVGAAFDLVLLDSPPVLGAVDTRLLSKAVDAVLMVVKSGSTPRNLVSQAQESLQGENILGIVLNRMDPNQACFTTYYQQTASTKTNGQMQSQKALRLSGERQRE
jgi:capsular exopolysaccharide synthesis family protein